MFTGRQCRFARDREGLQFGFKRLNRQPVPATGLGGSASDWLARSYDEQSSLADADSVGRALHAARRAVEQSPDFAFAWARVAELEFSRGHTREADRAVRRSLAAAARHAPALALQGYLRSADNRIPEAIRAFDAALTVDGGFANAWLRRGRCSWIRCGRRCMAR